MKKYIIKSDEDLKQHKVEGGYHIKGNVEFEYSPVIKGGLLVDGNINAWNITALDINAGDITALDITAGDITAEDINAGNLTAWDISYYAFCCVTGSIKCKSIEPRRTPAHPPICLDGKLEILKETDECDHKNNDYKFCPHCGEQLQTK